jgi:hypothetical protein
MSFTPIVKLKKEYVTHINLSVMEKKMGKDTWKPLIMLFVGVLSIFSTLAAAEEKTAQNAEANQTVTQSSAPAASSSGTKSFRDWHNPTDWLELSGDFRFRFYYDHGAKFQRKTAQNERVITRYRARLQSKIKLTDDLDFNMQLITEPRYHRTPRELDKQLTYHEAIFNKFNLTWRNAFDLPLTITAGRQEIKFGTGWLISDGTPLDGGRTWYFDALRFTYKLKDSNTTADFILIDNHADSAKFLQPFNDRDIDLSEQDEGGAIFYLSNKAGKDAGTDLYLIYQIEHHRAISSGSEGEIYTIGFRKYGRLDEHWQYNMEFAPQFGHKNGKSLGAFGTNDFLVYNFNDEKKNKIYLGYEYLSGSDDKDKWFDRSWARVDTWSTLYQGIIDSIDGRGYEASNMHRLYVDWITMLTEKLELASGYGLFFADDNISSAGGTSGLSKSGNFRGQLLKACLKYRPTKNIEHCFATEVFIPGNYYNDDRNDIAVLAKYEFIFTW